MCQLVKFCISYATSPQSINPIIITSMRQGKSTWASPDILWCATICQWLLCGEQKSENKCPKSPYQPSSSSSDERNKLVPPLGTASRNRASKLLSKRNYSYARIAQTINQTWVMWQTQAMCVSANEQLHRKRQFRIVCLRRRDCVRLLNSREAIQVCVRVINKQKRKNSIFVQNEELIFVQCHSNSWTMWKTFHWFEPGKM